MNINAFATDEKAEINGSWCPLGEGARLLIAREDNPAYVQFIRTRMSRYNITAITEEEALILSIEAIANAILLDWEGLEDGEGEVVYSIEMAIKWLTKYKEFKKIVLNFAKNVSNYQLEHEAEVKEDIKKS